MVMVVVVVMEVGVVVGVGVSMRVRVPVPGELHHGEDDTGTDQKQPDDRVLRVLDL